MRVSDRGMFDAATRRMTQARGKVEEATARASTGVRVAMPWDDPASARAIAIETSTVERFDSLMRTADYAGANLFAQDAALGGATETLQRALELGVQMANDTYNAQQRAGAALEVEGLFKDLIATLNREQGGRYLFGGNLENAPPFDAAGVYQGDAGARPMEIAPGVTLETTIRTDQRIAGGVGVDVPATLVALQTALNSNNSANIRAAIGDLHLALDQVSQARSEIGSLSVTWEGSVTTSRMVRDVATERRSMHEDVDLIEAASELSFAQRAFEAAIASSTKGFELSLLKRM